MNDDASLARRLMTTRPNFRPCESSYPFSDAFVKFMLLNGFFAEIGRHLRKIPTRDVPTAGVTFDFAEDEFCLFWNPEFFEGLPDEQVQGVLHHEMYHLSFEHLLRLTPEFMQLMNVAQDLAINSIIVQNSQKDVHLPAFALVPGHLPSKRDGSQYTSDEIAESKLLTLLPSLKLGCSSQQYFQTLLDEGVASDDDGSMLLDVHLHCSKENEEYARSKMDSLLRIAVNAADSGKGWGNVPMHVQNALRQHLNRGVNWTSVLEHFVGSSVKGKQRGSTKRINQRYAYIHPGRTVSHRAKMLIAIDESGSVNDEMMSTFFDALMSLTREVDIDIIPFDCDTREDEIFAWRKGTTPNIVRTRSGGTNFSAPTMIVNDDLNTGRWDALLIMTDGEAAQPISCRLPRAWILPRGKSLAWECDETVIRLTENDLTFENM